MGVNREVKDWLKTQFKYDAFIEHTQVAEMCIAYFNHKISQLQDEACRFEEEYRESGHSDQEIIDYIIINFLKEEP